MIREIARPKTRHSHSAPGAFFTRRCQCRVTEGHQNLGYANMERAPLLNRREQRDRIAAPDEYRQDGKCTSVRDSQGHAETHYAEHLPLEDKLVEPKNRTFCSVTVKDSQWDLRKHELAARCTYIALGLGPIYMSTAADGDFMAARQLHRVTLACLAATNS